jgi:pyruvate dehydrogenase E1 component
VWGVFGDGEMDEPESMSALTLAAREGLDNLVWVVNCNLQRLDGPVRGNGRIIDELERLFAGAGWNVVKLVWGSDWDGLFARDLTGALVRTLEGTVDGQMQTFAAKDGRFNRDNFFGQNPELAALAQGMTDEQIDRLKRGGHDLVKIHAAYAAASAHQGQPTVILAHTKKGYGMGQAGQGKMTTHSQKKLDDSDLIEFRNRFNLPLSDAQATGLAFYKPPKDSPEMQYLRRHRQQLGGYLPRRETVCDALPVPPLASYAQFALAADGKEMSTTMAFVRMLGTLLKDATLGPRIVPIVADEARTFGMANLFKQVGIYSSVGQRYAPEDIGSVLSTARRWTDRSSKKASARPARSPAGRRRPPATACTAWPCCRSTSTTPCSASSAWATPSGPPPTSARAASCSAPPRAAPRWAARACSTRTAAATWWRPPSPTARPTTRPTRARWP